MQARRDEAKKAQLSRKTASKMARADLIEAQRQALLLEMQHIRKDILQQEAWLKVTPPPCCSSQPAAPLLAAAQLMPLSCTPALPVTVPTASQQQLCSAWLPSDDTTFILPLVSQSIRLSVIQSLFPALFPNLSCTPRFL